MATDSYNVRVGVEQGGDRGFVKSGGSFDVESGGELDIESGASFKLAGTAVSATAAELNRATDVSGRLVAAGGTLAVTVADHDGKIICLDTAAGSVCTLPAAVGSGAVFRFVVSVLATSNSHIVKVTGNDVMQGLVFTVDDTSDAVYGWRTADDSDTVTLNRTTTGSVERGEYLEFIDVAADLWLVRGFIANSGSQATPFSATVA